MARRVAYRLPRGRGWAEGSEIRAKGLGPPHIHGVGRGKSKGSGAVRRRGPKGPFRWTEKAIERELRAFTRERANFPSHADFRRAGRSDLLGAIERSGGTRRWATRLGLPLRSGQDRRSVDAAALVAQARTVIAAEGRLPNAKRLRQLGLVKLASAVTVAGGAKRFAARHGLSWSEGPGAD